MSPLPNLFGRGRAERRAIARVRAVRAIQVERRVACARSALTRTRPKRPVRPLPSCARERWLASCHLAVKTSAGEAICYMSPLPNIVWERSSRAFSDCSGEGCPSNPRRTPHRVCAVDPHPDEAWRARPTSPELRSGEVARGMSPRREN